MPDTVTKLTDKQLRRAAVDAKFAEQEIREALKAVDAGQPALIDAAKARLRTALATLEG